MVPGIVTAIGFGLTIVGGFGSMATSIDYRPDRGMVALFIGMFLVGMGMVGGGLSAIA